MIDPTPRPGTMLFWHGGDLENMSMRDDHRFGRTEYGPGLYLTTSYNLASSYSKGSRKLYLVHVKHGNDMSDHRLPISSVMEFIKLNVMASKRKEIIDTVENWTNDGTIGAETFNNILINEGAVKPSNKNALRRFFVDQGIDYLITGNISGWGGNMMVLFNFDKIDEIRRFMPGDRMDNYDLHQGS